MLENITISGYVKEIRDRIANDETWTPQNIAKSRVFGIDIETENTYKNLSYSLIYSYLDGYDEENDIKKELQHQPKHSISGIISYECPITAEISGKWKGVRKRFFTFVGWKTEDPAFILDVGISRKINGFKFGFSVDNVLDTEYITNFGSSYNDRNYPGMGRYFNIWTEYSF